MSLNPKELKNSYPQLHEIIAVSKTFSLEAIQEVMALGYTHFGENKAQELSEKAKANYPITWHFIGHLQTNKVKDVVKVATWIHSVDSIRLLKEIEKQASKLNKTMNVLIQVNLTQEMTKSGCTVDEIDELVQLCPKCPHVICKGLMVIGPTDAQDNEIEIIFKQAHQLSQNYALKYPHMTELSMGMSHDYELALQNGASFIRIGSLIFGDRKKKD